MVRPGAVRHGPVAMREPRSRRPALLGLAALALTATACSAVAPPAATTEPSATLAPTPLPTASPTPEPVATATPKPQAVLEVGRTFARAWEDSVTGSFDYQVVVEARNVGTVPADFGTSKREYRLLDATGATITEGSFTYAFPPVIEPGASAFFIDSDGLPEGVAPAAVAGVEADLAATAADASVPVYVAANVALAPAEVGNGLKASGTLTNPTSAASTSVVVAVIFFDAADAIVGAVLDNYSVTGLAAGASTPFETQDFRSPPMAPTAVAHHLLVAYDAGF